MGKGDRRKKRDTSNASEDPDDLVNKVAKEVSCLLRDRTENTRWRPTVKPPIFSGAPHESPSLFLGRFDPYLEELTDEEKIAAVGDQLRGEAAEWFRRFEGIESTWSGFQSRFVGRFDGEDVRENLQRSMWCDVQDAATNTTEFILSKFRLWKRLDGKDEGRFVKRVIAQLLPSLQLDTYLARPSTLDELLLWVERIEASRTDTSRPARQSTSRYVAPPRRNETPTAAATSSQRSGNQ